MGAGVGELATDDTDMEIAVPEDEDAKYVEEFDSLIPPMSPCLPRDDETGELRVAAT